MNDEKLSKIVAETVKQINSANAQITLSAAKKLAEIIEQKAKEIGVKAVVAVTNIGARPVLVECMDDSFIASYDVALKKAYTVVALKMPTIKLKEITKPGDSLYGIQFTNNGQIVVFGGGDPLVYNSNIIGGLGVSGGTEEQDTYLSAYGASKIAEIMKGAQTSNE